ncbi:MAG TPA: carbamoyltransferase [Bryobacteraceae bacterium]|nr:carbamoyltransferase [Bryobacteraceae bacterium]
MRILGISAFYHDSASALVRDGEIVAAAQEERFTRRKHDARFPAHAIHYCLAEEGVRLDEVDYVVFYDKPFLKFERLLETYLAYAPRGLRSFQMAIPVWLQEKLFQKRLLQHELNKHGGQDIDWERRLLFTEHHLSHAASAFFPSPFEEAAILIMDGVGEWATTSSAMGRGNHLEITKEIHFPHSLGLLYSAFTYYTGFEVNSGEYKVMGLAPYGKPGYTQLIFDNLLDAKPDGSFRLNLEFFDYCTGLKMTNHKFDRLFGGPARKPDEPLTQRHMDLAASIQVALEEVILRMTRSLARETGAVNLCLAGGVALNCVCNGKILRDGHFKNLWVQPAAGDAGGAVGAALAAYHLYRNQPRLVETGDRMKGSYLGPAFAQLEIERRLTEAGAVFTVMDDDRIVEATVDALVDQKVVGWFQGRMEFGPRALGARSILGDPRAPHMQSLLNAKVKRRESFRPFAPSVLREDVKEWFELDVDSPYMSLVANVVPNRPAIPAVTHVDCSARIQTVHHSTNPRFHALLTAFKKRTGLPVLLNTSFNVRDEPIVCYPEDAYRCFIGTGIDVLIAGNCLLRKGFSNPPAR